MAVEGSGDIIVTCTSGGIDFGGGYLSPGSMLPGVIFAKFDTEGNHIWSQCYGDAGWPYSQWAHSVAVGVNGDIFLTGKCIEEPDFTSAKLPSAVCTNRFFAKYDADGNRIWDYSWDSIRYFTTGEGTYRQCVAVDGEGNVVVTGEIHGTEVFGDDSLTSNTSTDMFVAKFDTDGNYLWGRCFGYLDPQIGNFAKVAADSMGNVVVAGSLDGTADFGGGPLTSAGGDDIFVACFDTSGTHLWSQLYGGVNAEVLASVAVDDASNIILTGEFNGSVDFGGGALTSAGGYDLCLVKLDAGGTHLWSQRFGDSSNQDAARVIVNDLGNIILTGEAQNAVDFGGGPLICDGRIFVATFDTDGVHLWSNDFEAPEVYGMGVDDSGNVTLTGLFAGTINFGGDDLECEYTDIYLVKFTDQCPFQSDSCDVQPKILNFGGIAMGDSADLDFTIRNLGCDYMYGSVTESCEYYEIVAGAGSYSLAPGDSQVVTVRFKPALPGAWHCTIQTGAECANVSCEAYVCDPGGFCDVQPVSLNFGAIAMGDSADLDFTIQNVGCGTDTLNGSISESCEHYEIAAGAGSYSLAPGDSHVVTVRFKPTLLGTWNCTIQTGAECANVSCEGISYEPPPACLIEPDTLDFGNVDIGNYRIITFDITNTGYGTLEGTMSESCDNFTIMSGGTYSLGHNESQTVSIFFIAATAGPHECTIETGNAACTDVYCMAYGGIEPLPECLVNPDTLDCGTVIVGDSLDMMFDIINMGGGVLSGTVTDTCGCFDVVSGGGAYALSADETLHVTVRFKPEADASYECWVETGTADCIDVFCMGMGDDVSGLRIVDANHFHLYQNYPNPFNPVTNITFTVPNRSHTNLSIYNIEGKLVKTLVDTDFAGGVKTVNWNGTDSKGNPVSTGVYFYRLRAGSEEMTRKMVLLK